MNAEASILGCFNIKMKIAVTAGTVLLSALLLIAAILGICDAAVPNTVSAMAKADMHGAVSFNSLSDGSRTVARIFGLPFKEVEVSRIGESKVYLGGDAIGVKFYTGGVIVVGLSATDTGDRDPAPAKKAGLKTGDIITTVNGEKVRTVEQFREILEASGGAGLSLEFMRGEKQLSCVLYPILKDDGYKAGMWIRDSTAGIGTVTFVTEKGVFASLGHGICDVDTGVLMPLYKGSAVDVRIESAIKGKANSPGELKGIFSAKNSGELIKNTQTGLYGKTELKEERELVEVAGSDEIREGKAVIISTVDGSGRHSFECEIVRITNGAEPTKNFTVKITDDALIEKTGGIVQGMSGSPIVQNGKLVGAVTHVFVNDPTMGYGIFIENMLSEAEKIG